MRWRFCFMNLSKFISYSNLHYLLCKTVEGIMLDMVTKMRNAEEKVLQKLIFNYYNHHFKFLLQEEEIQLLSWEIQNEFIKRTIKSPLLEKYPMSIEFTKLYFKNLVNLLQEHQEIHDEFYSAICKINNKESFCFKHYLVSKDFNNIITMKETKHIVVNGTTGMKTWDAALMLADWALSNRHLFHVKNVLELGCGVGFTGIAIAMHCGVKQMWLTDYHETVLDTAVSNIEINLPKSSASNTKEGKCFRTENCEIGILPLDWTRLDSIPNSITPDVVIGADIVYDPSLIKPLCGVLNHFFQRNGNLTVYIQSTVRNEDTFRQFLDTLELNNLAYERIPHEDPPHFEWNKSIQESLLKIQCNQSFGDVS